MNWEEWGREGLLVTSWSERQPSSQPAMAREGNLNILCFCFIFLNL